jgi:hypothetical protein
VDGTLGRSRVGLGATSLCVALAVLLVRPILPFQTPASVATFEDGGPDDGNGMPLRAPASPVAPAEEEAEDDGDLEAFHFDPDLTWLAPAARESEALSHADAHLFEHRQELDRPPRA